MKKPRGPRRWSLLSPRQQYRLRHRRAKWFAVSDHRYVHHAIHLRVQRKQAKKSQREMAEKLGVSLRQYKRYESGQSMPVSS